MSLITSMRRQKAVWWERNDTPDKFVRYDFKAPVEIDCRWVDRASQIRNARDEAVNSKSVVYVDRPMKVGDKLAKGELNTATLDDPRPDYEAFEIIAFEDTPDFNAIEHLYTAHL